MQKFKAIKYIRLSYTDDKTVESNSVSNQRKLIDDFLAQHPEIEVVCEKDGDDKIGRSKLRYCQGFVAARS